MSHQLRFATAITDSDALDRACHRMREAGFAVVGPRYHEKRARRSEQGGGTRPAWTVKLPGWSQEAEFDCDAAGTMLADNYSPYYDERQIDPLTGQRVPNTGRVHPKVESGEKRVGDDGRWGDIKWLDRLNVEYRAALIETTLPQIGGTITSTEYDETTGAMTLMIETV
jgi:hypothetical protein